MDTERLNCTIERKLHISNDQLQADSGIIFTANNVASKTLLNL